MNYKLEQFEGPLDLLLSLIIKNKINIDDIPIALLCDQYMEYISRSVENHIEPASEFLLMASELMLIKSRMLLPRHDPEEEDPRRALADTVLEYQKAKLGAEELRSLFSAYGDRMIKEQDDLSDDGYVAPHSVDLLVSALTRVLTETKITSEAAKSSFEQIVSTPRVPIKTVVNVLLNTLKTTENVYLDDYFRASLHHSEMIAKFLGILELLKSQIIDLTDESGQGDGILNMAARIRVWLREEINESRLAELELDYDQPQEEPESALFPELPVG